VFIDIVILYSHELPARLVVMPLGNLFPMVNFLGFNLAADVPLQRCG
jgi:hypothetical protein